VNWKKFFISLWWRIIVKVEEKLLQNFVFDNKRKVVQLALAWCSLIPDYGVGRIHPFLLLINETAFHHFVGSGVFLIQVSWLCYAAFTLNGFDNQERNLIFGKTDFQVLKLKFYVCNFKQAFYALYKLFIAWPWQHKNTFIQAFCSLPGCQTCMCKRSIRIKILQMYFKCCYLLFKSLLDDSEISKRIFCM